MSKTTYSALDASRELACAHVWVTAYVTWKLDRNQQFLGRMAGVPTHEQEALGIADHARSEYLKRILELDWHRKQLGGVPVKRKKK